MVWIGLGLCVFVSFTFDSCHFNVHPGYLLTIGLKSSDINGLESPLDTLLNTLKKFIPHSATFRPKPFILVTSESEEQWHLSLKPT